MSRLFFENVVEIKIAVQNDESNSLPVAQVVLLSRQINTHELFLIGNECEDLDRRPKRRIKFHSLIGFEKYDELRNQKRYHTHRSLRIVALAKKP